MEGEEREEKRGRIEKRRTRRLFLRSPWKALNTDVLTTDGAEGLPGPQMGPPKL